MTQRWPDPLPCGRAMAELTAQVADGVPGDLGHQATCEHCQRTLAALQELWDATAALAAERVEAPGSIDRVVLRRVRRDIFIREVTDLIGGILPRLSRAFLVYAGLTGASERR